MQVSVIMPAYNAEKYISEAIKSIISQSLEDFELIVVDDGSTDKTLEISNHFADHDHRIRVLRKDNGGISSALNLGINESRCPWIAIMHADDIALPQRLEKQIHAARMNINIVAWGAYAYHVNKQGHALSISQVGPKTEEEFYDIRKTAQHILVIHPTALLNKAVLIKAGGYNSYFDGSEDLELFDRMAEYGPILALPEPLLLYRVHSNSLSMHRHFDMAKFTRYVKDRQKRRLSGKKEIDFDQFIRECRQQPRKSRKRQYIKDLTRFYYRRSGVLYGDGKIIEACFYYFISVALNPKYSLTRIWRQMLSKKARQELNNATAKIQI